MLTQRGVFLFLFRLHFPGRLCCASTAQKVRPTWVQGAVILSDTSDTALTRGSALRHHDVTQNRARHRDPEDFSDHYQSLTLARSTLFGMDPSTSVVRTCE